MNTTASRRFWIRCLYTLANGHRAPSYGCLVFKEIFESELSDDQALKYVKESPPSLNSLHDRLMEKDENAIGQDNEYCRAVVATSCFALPPPSYAELDVLARLPDLVKSDSLFGNAAPF